MDAVFLKNGGRGEAAAQAANSVHADGCSGQSPALRTANMDVIMVKVWQTGTLPGHSTHAERSPKPQAPYSSYHVRNGTENPTWNTERIPQGFPAPTAAHLQPLNSKTLNPSPNSPEPPNPVVLAAYGLEKLLDERIRRLVEGLRASGSAFGFSGGLGV